MRNKFRNSVEVSGYVFNHNLTKRTSKKGQEYISGTLNVALTETGESIVPINFGYVVPTFKSGKTNQAYGTLSQIIENNDTVEVTGVDNATVVRISGEFEENSFVNKDDEMVSSQRIRGSFIHVIPNASQLPPEESRATFDIELLANRCAEREIGDDTFVELSGYVFNFRNDFQQVSFRVKSEAGMSFFLDQDISGSNPFLGRVWGNIVNTTVSRENKVESAFGAPQVHATSFSRREYVVEGAAAEQLEFGSEEVMTVEDVKTGLVDREARIQEVRDRHDEYVRSQNMGGGAKSAFGSSAPKAAVKSESPFDDGFEF